MPRRRDPNYTTGHLCRFCGQLVPWGAILRLIRVDPDTPGYMLLETACHTECLRKHLRPGVELTFHRHWNGKAPMLDDSADIYFPLSPRARGRSGLPGSIGKVPMECPRREGEGAEPSSPAKAGAQPERRIRPCVMCGKDIAPDALVRLRVQKPVGPVKKPWFDEQTLPLHFECLAAVSNTRFG
jgi:hypothetical protein